MPAIKRKPGSCVCPGGQARPDWWILCEVAKRLGFVGFNYSGPAAIFDEHARLSGTANGGQRAFDIGGLAGLSPADYDAMAPVQWPVPGGKVSCDVAVQECRRQDVAVIAPMDGFTAILNSNITAHPSTLDGKPSPAGRELVFQGRRRQDVAVAASTDGFTAALEGKLTPSSTHKRLCATDFYTPNRKANLIAVQYRPPHNAPDSEYPFVLNTGRIRDQWHTMTRSGQSARLGGHLPEPFVEIHPRDALLCGVGDGHLARLRSRWGEVVLRLKFSVETPRGSVFVPIHWNGTTASDARIGKLVNPVVDPLSGEPEFKHTPVMLESFAVDWHGFALSRRPIEPEAFAYWARATGEQFLRYELAGRFRPADWSSWGRGLLGAQDEQADVLEYVDATANLYRAALVVNERIEACVFISPRLDLPSRQWLASLFAKDQLEELDRISLLVGRPADPAADAGPTVCSCFGVGRNVILREIQARQLDSPEAIGGCLKAGTNCGSCVPELRKLLAESRLVA